MRVHGWGYAAVFAACLGGTLLLTPVARWYADRRGVLDHPGDYKAQESPVPYLGGAAIVMAFAVVILVATLLRPPTSGLRELIVILGVATGLSLVGLVDDLRGLGPFLRVGLE